MVAQSGGPQESIKERVSEMEGLGSIWRKVPYAAPGFGLTKRTRRYLESVNIALSNRLGGYVV